MLAMFVSREHDNWDDLLPFMMLAYRSSVFQRPELLLKDTVPYAFPIARTRSDITRIQGRAGHLRGGRLVQHVARSSSALSAATTE